MDDASRADDGPPNRPPEPSRLARAWADFYAYCRTIIVRVPDVRRLSEADREDVAQEVMVDVIRRFGAEDPEALRETIGGWIHVLSRNKAVDVMRRRYRRPETGFDDGSGEALPDGRPAGGPDPRDARGDDVADVWVALGTLDDQVHMTSYVVFFLRTVQGWGVSEVAELFGLTPEQVRARCHRVRKKLDAEIGGRGRDAGAGDE